MLNRPLPDLLDVARYEAASAHWHSQADLLDVARCEDAVWKALVGRAERAVLPVQPWQCQL